MGQEYWRGRSVLVTGHTGFKGAWLTAWLEMLGAEVHGVSLAPGHDDMYAAMHGWVHSSKIADLRSADLSSWVREVQPGVVFHLAAQSTVQNGYRHPEATFATNVMGSVRLLNALRSADTLRTVLVVTTDKVYGDAQATFTETDRTVATDPYAASKVAQEVVVESFRHSYFDDATLLIARAGNVIGGGDAGPNRLVPDCVRAVRAGKALTLRYPDAVRPWQHVLDPLHGYLIYARSAAESAVPPVLNFGPDPSSITSVRSLAEDVMSSLTGAPARVECEPVDQRMDENPHLTIDASAAAATLGWKPMLDLRTAIDWTTDWYAAAQAGEDLRRVTIDQIDRYEELVG